MREATGTLNTFRIVIIFTLFFACFITLAITYNKIIKLKNESISIIELYEGVTYNSVPSLNNYLRNSGYNGHGQCDDGEYGLRDLNSTDLTQVGSNDNTRYLYCLKMDDVTASTGSVKIYYNVKLFYNFDIPLFGGVSLMTFKINSETKRITYHQDLANSYIIKRGSL